VNQGASARQEAGRWGLDEVVDLDSAGVSVPKSGRLRGCQGCLQRSVGQCLRDCLTGDVQVLVVSVDNRGLCLGATS
jgi:hypothetical protein